MKDNSLIRLRVYGDFENRSLLHIRHIEHARLHAALCIEAAQTAHKAQGLVVLAKGRLQFLLHVVALYGTVEELVNPRRLLRTRGEVVRLQAGTLDRKSVV